ncbi:MAG TPA: glycosyltransferase family 2 protein [Terriglobales bacterium]|nr:glycosyltransferase family 2 protein [Terriglobales bacterium]
MNESVCAVIVTYNPQARFVEDVAAIAAQVGCVVVVDNGSSNESAKPLLGLETRPSYKIIRNLQNLGIAAALNQGVNYAIDGGFDWICTFDQDSSVGDGFISIMLETYFRSADLEKVALITPTYVDRDSGIPVRLRRARNGEILATMTSGTLVPTKAIRKLGLFDETLFIDGVDTEFCLRARRQGMSILQSPAVLTHSLGRTTYHHLLGLHFGATNHSAARRYYIARNRWILLARYASDWPWVWREIKTMVFDSTKIALVEESKWAKFRAMAAGTRGAIAGRVGKQREL